MKRFTLLFVALCCVSLSSTLAFASEQTLPGNTIFTALSDIVAAPLKFDGRIVSVQATFQGWKNAPGKPPVTRSDWVAQDAAGTAVYCTGAFPEDMRPGDPTAQGRRISILGTVHLDDTGRPFIVVSTALPEAQVETMVSVSQLLFDPVNSRGKLVGLLGVLSKGYGPRGQRMYLLADPTGAITLGRMPKLYPKGTILRLRGIVSADENGLPQITDVEILSAKP
ncbi:MAG TPA: hypothetical protein PKO06_20795 [Candidatus Ozemobacteraceae bacterium]|nr:hypothetical protein [Candidatus Ozemobacteraceae bacterium]